MNTRQKQHKDKDGESSDEEGEGEQSIIVKDVKTGKTTEIFEEGCVIVIGNSSEVSKVVENIMKTDMNGKRPSCIVVTGSENEIKRKRRSSIKDV